MYYFLISLNICILEFVELIVFFAEVFVVFVLFIFNIGKLVDVDVFVCVGRVRLLFVVLEDGFCEVREVLFLEFWFIGCVKIK